MKSVTTKAKAEMMRTKLKTTHTADVLRFSTMITVLVE